MGVSDRSEVGDGRAKIVYFQAWRRASAGRAMAPPLHCRTAQGEPMPEKPGRIGLFFENFARAVTHFTGSTPAFTIAAGIIVVWGVTGPVFHFSDTWQLVINTGTTIVTFLM